LWYDYFFYTGLKETALFILTSGLNDMRPFARIIILYVAAMVAVSFPGPVCAESPFPKPAGPVNDFADVITPPYEKRIANIAKELTDQTGAALFVVTVPDLGDADANAYAERLYSTWDSGKKGSDKGILILISIRERKLQVRTGAGLKALLSQRQIGEIQDRFVAPYLKQNNYDDGLLNGVLAIAKIIAKESGVTLKGIEP
jgi:uncharacterized protein